MKTMNRLASVALGLTTVPFLGGCVAASYPNSTPMYSDYSGYAVVHTRNVSIGINLPAYPSLVRIPGYPVYYAPDVSSNYFFYDGVYWVFWNDGWYQSTWYNGPWDYVSPDLVPLFILRVPVRYYRHPPTYFRGWRSDAPPHWGEHWGQKWEQRRRGWNQWNRGAVPAPAPLPHYQRQYSGPKYPPLKQQPRLRAENYRYQPHDPAGRQLYQERERERQQMRTQPQQPAQRGFTPAPQQQRQPTFQQRNQPTPQQRNQPTPQQRNQQQREFQRFSPQAPVQQRTPSIQRQAPPVRGQQRPQSQPKKQLQQQGVPGRAQQPGAGQRGAPQGKEAAPQGNRKQQQDRDQDREYQWR